MTTTLIQMAILIACGSFWRFLEPAGLKAEPTRLVLTTLVFYLMLPALVLKVLWQADIGIHSFRYTQLGFACVVLALLIFFLLSKIFKFEDRRLGAMMLATAFANVTYLGLPVLEQTFGEWARSVVIQIDLFGTSPFVLTIGIMLARKYGHNANESKQSLLAFLNVPPFWAAGLAVILNIKQVTMAVEIEDVLEKLADGVVPLMLFSLGLALDWKAVRLHNLPYMFPVVLIKLCLMPLFALWFSGYLGFTGEIRMATVLEMAMPCMVLGIVFCDRYHLDSSLYAMAVTVTTILSMITLPLWYDYLVFLK